MINLRRRNISTALGEALAERGAIHQPPLEDGEKAVANADTPAVREFTHQPQFEDGGFNAPEKSGASREIG